MMNQNFYEYYIFGDCYCVVGTTLAFEGYEDMIDLLGDDCEQVETPENTSDDMITY